MTRPGEPHRRIDWGLVLWLACTMLTLVIVTAIFFAWAVRHALANGQHLSPRQREMVLAVADFPGLVRDALQQVLSAAARSPAVLLMERDKTQKPHWVRRFPAPEDPGYLLFAGLDPRARRSVVTLLRISDGAELARWDPDWNDIYRRITDKKFAEKGTSLNARAMHPVLLPDGDIVFNTAGTALVRLGRCSGAPVWVLDEPMHHSNHLDDAGTIWTPGLSFEGLAANPWLLDRVRDDALVRISQDGKVLERHSFAKILRANGLDVLLFGTGGHMLQTDPVHLNEIVAAPADTAYWRRGDLLISARHLSAVFLYRPSTGRILWHRMGPWLNQHAADFVDDHRISVFDNNVFGGAPKEQPFVVPGEINRVFVYDFASGELSQPYAHLLAQAKPVTLSEGRAQLLADGGLFVEESNFGRHLRFTADRLLWSRVNDYDDKRIGVVSWSRYLTAEQGVAALNAIASRPCPRS